MNKDQVFSLIRHILSIVGGILIAKGVMGDQLVLDISGALLALVSVVWSVIDKTFVLGSVEGVLRQVATAVAGYLIWKGHAAAATQVNMWLGILLGIIAVVLGQTDKLWATATPKSGT